MSKDYKVTQLSYTLPSWQIQAHINAESPGWDLMHVHTHPVETTPGNPPYYILNFIWKVKKQEIANGCKD